MAKQTRRKSNIFSNDLKNRNEPQFIRYNLSKTSPYKKIIKFSIIPKSYLSRDNPEPNQKKSSHRNFSNYKLYKSNTPSFNSYKYTPDFKRYLGRYHENKHINKKIEASNEGIYYPNYTSIQERTKMMVLYGPHKDKENNKAKNFNLNKFKGVASSDFLNVPDAFDKIKLNKSRISPKFEKMISRPSDKSLPSFMQGLYNRIGANIMTDKSLKLNNYSNGEIYFDIYKTNSTVPKCPKKDEEEDEDKDKDDLNYLNDKNENENEYEENKVNEIKEEEKVIKLHKEINKIIWRMNTMYNNYINSKF